MSTNLAPAWITNLATTGEIFVRAAAPDLRRKLTPVVERSLVPGDNPRIARDVPITSEHIDGDGDIVRADGLDVDTRYRRNPIVLLQHGRTADFPVIGGNARIERADVDGKPGWVAREFLFGDTKLAREIQSLWNDLILRTTSIGFRAIDWEPIDKDGQRLDPQDRRAMERQTGFEFTRSMLFEFSIVAVPSNLHASKELDGLLLGKSAAAFFDLGAQRKACAKCVGSEQEKSHAAGGPVSAPTINGPEYLIPKSVVERHAATLATMTPSTSTVTISLDPDANVSDIVKAVNGALAASVTAAPGLVSRTTEPEPLARVAQLLKAISLERCPGCKGVNLYSREASSFLEHRSKEGPRCETKALVGEPCGPTVKTIADGIRERTRDETKLAKDAIPADAFALVEALAAVGDMKALAGWAGVVVKEVGELISKAGRVLSAETRRTIETQLASIESGIEAATKAIEAMRGAARGLKDFLAAADREDTTPSDEAKASPAGGQPSVDDQLRDPQVQAALDRLLATTR